MGTDGYFDYVEEMVRVDERQKMIDEGYIHKSECPRAREDDKRLKKENKSLQRKITELQCELYSDKMMRS